MFENGISTLTGDIKLYSAGYHNDPSIDYRINNADAVESKILTLLPEQTQYASRVRASAVVSNARHSAGVTLVGIDPEKDIVAASDGRVRVAEDATLMPLSLLRDEPMGLKL